MTCGVCFRYWRTELYSSPLFSCGFTGSCASIYDDMDDAMLSEHLDALGYDYSFQGWFWELRTNTPPQLFLNLRFFWSPKARLVCRYVYICICKPYSFGPWAKLFLNLYFCLTRFISFMVPLYSWVINGMKRRSFKWKRFLHVCSMFLNQMPYNTLVLEP